jgi:hypothetical protein
VPEEEWQIPPPGMYEEVDDRPRTPVEMHAPAGQLRGANLIDDDDDDNDA